MSGKAVADVLESVAGVRGCGEPGRGRVPRNVRRPGSILIRREDQFPLPFPRPPESWSRPVPLAVRAPRHKKNSAPSSSTADVRNLKTSPSPGHDSVNRVRVRTLGTAPAVQGRFLNGARTVPDRCRNRPRTVQEPSLGATKPRVPQGHHLTPGDGSCARSSRPGAFGPFGAGALGAC